MQLCPYLVYYWFTDDLAVDSSTIYNTLDNIIRNRITGSKPKTIIFHAQFRFVFEKVFCLIKKYMALHLSSH